MVLKKGIWQALILGVFCTGSISCATLTDLLVEPFEASVSSKKKSTTPKKQAKACYPVRDREITYTVRKGDTLGEIAECFKTRWYYIAKRNKIRDPNRIKIGQKLIIPARSGKVATSSGKKSKSTATSSRPPTRAKSGINWTWPAQGKIIRKFSSKGSGRQGISISGKMGQKIVSAAPGKVVYSGEGLVGYGKLIIVQHKKEFLTAYAHNNRLLVKEGQSVKRGQTIAHMGKTAAKSPRLHFEIRYKGNAVDPLKYLP
ncbi:MAG: peptidoglycan DD-metalloendopeptidase family protein [Gammaproteobacteria bacterium]|nr:peptidoglycan DD-metalloendopeptidase family protein [Gammaproteobacteria bacterium]